jgi:hypothetical protein
VLAPDSWPEEEGGSDEWVHSSVRERRWAAYLFGTGRSWAVGLFWGWAGRDAPGLFNLFLFSPFSFSVSKFFSFKTFAKELQFQSNQKPIFSKIRNNVLRQ